MSSSTHQEFVEEFIKLLDDARVDERVRACRIILEAQLADANAGQKTLGEHSKSLIEKIMNGASNGLQGQRKS